VARGRLRGRQVAPCLLASMLLLAPALRAQQPASDLELERRVRQAMTVVHVHGVTEQVANAEVGAEGVPVLRRLLFEPDLDRRDSVVAFLARLGDDASVPDLLAFLEHPPASPTVPEEDRALLMAPQALGYIAARGHEGAMDALLMLTEEGRGRDLLACAAAVAPRPDAYLQDLLEQAVFGLGIASADSRARWRLVDLSEGRIELLAPLRSLGAVAARTLRTFVEPDAMRPASADSADDPGDFGSVDRAHVGGTPALGIGELPGVLIADPQAEVENTAWTYGNHVEQSSPMTNARLDQITARANLIIGRSDFALDVACCATFSRSGNGGIFGTVGDGLDTIDDFNELTAVLNNPVGRVKIVRLINWCGAANPGIVGCSYTAGNGMAVERLTNGLNTETAVWVHEYGHNAGLGHNSSDGITEWLMAAVVSATSNGIDQNNPANAVGRENECATLHSPPAGTGAVQNVTGPCDDTDADGVHDGVDNCPSVANANQADADGDGVGDACEGGCPPSDPDSDGDGSCDSVDGCPSDPLKIAPGACGCGVADVDNDGDGTPNCNDGCPNDPLKVAPGACGCGVPDGDSDGDGVRDCFDGCPNDPLKVAPGACGCGVSDGDGDGDGVRDCDDGCPSDPLKVAPGACGCGVADGDGDGDGTPDCSDGCPTDPLKVAPGACGCGVPDANADGDNRADCVDNCPLVANDGQQDADGDGVGNACEACPGFNDHLDGDGDGRSDGCDGCPSDPMKVAPGACGCGVSDADGDGDGTPNCNDGCPSDPLKVAPDACGCGVSDADDDGDGTPNCNDGCPSDPLKLAPGACGCGAADADINGDGVPDCLDDCPDDPLKTSAGACGCGVADTDTDADGVPDCNDLCPSDPSKVAPGACGCDVPDTDGDGDTTPDCNDGCPGDPLKLAPGACGCDVPDADSDGDGPADCIDNCPAIVNPAQADLDSDGMGDACDPDIDDDGAPNLSDCAPTNPGDAVTVPELTNLRVARGAAGEALLSWDDAPAGMALEGEYLVTSGRVRDLSHDRDFHGACGARGSRAPAFIDERGGAGIGDAWYYLVQGANDCGAGDAGSSSGGATDPREDIVWGSLPPC